MLLPEAPPRPRRDAIGTFGPSRESADTLELGDPDERDLPWELREVLLDEEGPGDDPPCLLALEEEAGGPGRRGGDRRLFDPRGPLSGLRAPRRGGDRRFADKAPAPLLSSSPRLASRGGDRPALPRTSSLFLLSGDLSSRFLLSSSRFRSSSRLRCSALFLSSSILLSFSSSRRISSSLLLISWSLFSSALRLSSFLFSSFFLNSS